MSAGGRFFLHGPQGGGPSAATAVPRRREPEATLSRTGVELACGGRVAPAPNHHPYRCCCPNLLPSAPRRCVPSTLLSPTPRSLSLQDPGLEGEAERKGHTTE